MLNTGSYLGRHLRTSGRQFIQLEVLNQGGCALISTYPFTTISGNDICSRTAHTKEARLASN